MSEQEEVPAEPMSLSSAKHFFQFSVHTSPSVKDVKTRFKRLALQYHPDKAKPTSTKSGTKFTTLLAAYEILLGEAVQNELQNEEKQRELDQLEMLKRALCGENVEPELQRMGFYRPPANFGCAPYPPWETCRSTGSRGAKGVVLDSEEEEVELPGGGDMNSFWKEFLAESGVDEEGNPVRVESEGEEEDGY